MTSKEKINPNKTARIAGMLYLLGAILGGFGILYVPSLIVANDTAATINNILASQTLFRISFVSGLIGQTVFIFLALTLYKLLSPVNKGCAILMVIMALTGIPIAMLNQLCQAAALLLLSDANYLTQFTNEQLHAQVMFFLDLSKHGIFIAQIFWGLWLLPFGYLVYKSGFFPKILGILLIVGCFGYLIDFFAFFLFPNVDLTVSGYTAIGELVFPLWALVKGVNTEQWGK